LALARRPAVSPLGRKELGSERLAGDCPAWEWGKKGAGWPSETEEKRKKKKRERECSFVVVRAISLPGAHLSL